MKQTYWLLKNSVSRKLIFCFLIIGFLFNKVEAGNTIPGGKVFLIVMENKN